MFLLSSTSVDAGAIIGDCYYGTSVDACAIYGVLALFVNPAFQHVRT